LIDVKASVNVASYRLRLGNIHFAIHEKHKREHYVFKLYVYKKMWKFECNVLHLCLRHCALSLNRSLSISF